MADLPDLVLLEVFRQLNTLKLLRVREVCRRWRDLALEPAAWSHRKWYVDILSEPRKRLLDETVLRLAPRLRKLFAFSAEGRDASSPESVALLRSIADTRCAVQVLHLQLSHLPSIARAIQRQVQLGYVKKIEVALMLEPHSKYTSTSMFEVRPQGTDGFSELLPALATSGVQKLVIGNLACFVESFVSGKVKEAVDACSGAVLTPSLKSLSCELVDGLFAILVFLVRAHAASLEEIILPVSPFVAEPLFSDFPAPLPNLRRLECPILPDMTQLLGSPYLQSLHIYLTGRMREHPGCLASAALFFRQATQLQSLTLEFQFPDDDAILSSPALLNMVSAVGAAGCSALESLSLQTHSLRPKTALLRALASTLSGLPRLRTLKIEFYRDSRKDLLRSLLPAAGVHPCLEKLTVQAFGSVIDDCPHVLCHRDDVRSAMRSNPRLHVFLMLDCALWGRDCRHNDACATCMADCHPKLKKMTERGFNIMGMYSHPDSQPCSLHDRSFGYASWTRIMLGPDQAQSKRSKSSKPSKLSKSSSAGAGRSK